MSGTARAASPPIDPLGGRRCCSVLQLPRIAQGKPRDSEAIRSGMFYNCRVGETHQVFPVIGGLHPADNELPGSPLRPPIPPQGAAGRAPPDVPWFTGWRATFPTGGRGFVRGSTEKSLPWPMSPVNFDMVRVRTNHIELQERLGRNRALPRMDQFLPCEE
jgi:hypothetical protein